MSSPSPVVNRRHAFGLPAGSVHALHVLGVVSIFCLMLLIPARHDLAVPPYLIYLLFIIVAHFYTAHGTSIATRVDPRPSPLHLPGGTIRALVIVMLAGTIGWKYYSDPEGLYDRYAAAVQQLSDQPFMPLYILGGFLAGTVVRGVIGSNPPIPWQEFEAYVSVMALIGILGDGLIRIVVIPSLSQTYSLPLWETILGTTVAFYFGERT